MVTVINIDETGTAPLGGGTVLTGMDGNGNGNQTACRCLGINESRLVAERAALDLCRHVHVVLLGRRVDIPATPGTVSAAAGVCRAWDAICARPPGWAQPAAQVARTTGVWRSRRMIFLGAHQRSVPAARANMDAGWTWRAAAVHDACPVWRERPGLADAPGRRPRCGRAGRADRSATQPERNPWLPRLRSRTRSIADPHGWRRPRVG